MATIVLLHSALGLRPAVLDAAEWLRSGGHTVMTPDYYEGHVFDDEATGVAYRDEVGVRELMGRARSALDHVPPDAVLAGFSLGAFFAQAFAAKRPLARAAVLLHSAAAPKGAWNGVPVQLHRCATDPWIKTTDVHALAAVVRSSGAAFEDVVVPGEGHLFTDLDTPDGNARAYADSLDRFHAFVS